MRAHDGYSEEKKILEFKFVIQLLEGKGRRGDSNLVS